MKNLTKYLGFLLLTIAIGCAQNYDSASLEMADEKGLAEAQENSCHSMDRKLIKEGHIEFESDNLKSTRQNVFQAVNEYNGYVSSDREFDSPGRKSNRIVIRVPANNFDNLLQYATQGVVDFDSKEINVKDVTVEFLDVQARLKTKKELESRYLEILKQAKNVTEMLEVEKQLETLRSEIESMEGQLQYLQNRVSYSTLTITFYERIPNETAFGQKFKNAFTNGWDNLIWFFVLLTNIWPFILVGIGLYLGVRFYQKRK